MSEQGTVFRRWVKWGFKVILWGFLWVMVPVLVEGVMGPPGLRISPETTWLVEPVDAEGMLDFAAAWNEMYEHRVSPGENAAMGLVDVMGLDRLYEKADWQRPAEWMGLNDEAMEAGEKWRLTERPGGERRGTQLVRDAGKKPWSGEEWNEELATWLDRNDGSLDHVVAMVKRDAFYLPVEAAGGIDIEPMFTHVREDVSEPLAARAMRHITAGAIDDAIEDAEALCRLGGWIGESPRIMPVLVGYAIRSSGWRVMREVAFTQRCTMEQLHRMMKLVESQRRCATMADAINIGERVWGLHFVCEARYGGDAKYEGFRKIGHMVDVNEALRVVNDRFDELNERLLVEDPRERIRRIQAVEDELKQAKIFHAGDLWCLLNPWPGAKRRQAGVIGGRLIESIILPVMSRAFQFEQQHMMEQQLTRLSLALAMYHMEHGKYPAQLSELAPTYIEKVSEDLMSNVSPGLPLHYQQKGDGFVLYSVGLDGVDDHAIKDSYGVDKDLVIRCRQEP